MKKTIFCLFSTMIIFSSCGSDEEGYESHTETAPLPVGNTPTLTSFIPKDSANKMLTSYLNSIDYTTNDTNVKSFVIDVDQLRTYLDSANPTGLKIMLAHTLDYINSGNGGVNAGYRSGALTIVIAGFDEAGAYTYYGNNLVVDKSRFCPPNCPTGDAGSPFLED